RSLQRAAVLPAALVGADRSHGLAVEGLAEAQPVEDARGVRSHVDAAADLGQLGRLLVDVDVEAGLEQRDGRGEAADAGTDDRDLERFAGHGAQDTGTGCRAAKGLTTRSRWPSPRDRSSRRPAPCRG